MKRELPEGYTVKYHHQRNIKVLHADKMSEEIKVLDPCGGFTIVDVFNDENTLVCAAVAICRYDEQFNKKIGATVALGRALYSIYEDVSDVHTHPPGSRRRALLRNYYRSVGFAS